MTDINDISDNKSESKSENKSENKSDPNNGWSFEHDELLAKWSDKAACYTWMHEATQRKFSGINMSLGIPVILLSTISGTANFGISTIFPAGFSYGNAVIGVVSLITGLLSTISNFLGYAQSEEAHRIAGVQWSKFKRTIETELSINPNERKDAKDFIKYCKAELDRLMEQSPIIPQEIISKFLKVFRKVKNVKMPEICNKLEPTTLYSDLYNSRTNNVDNKIESLLSANKLDITTTDRNIIENVNVKINKLMTSSAKPSQDTVEDETVIHYSNEVPDAVPEETNVVPDTVPEETNVVQEEVQKKRFNKLIVFGRNR